MKFFFAKTDSLYKIFKALEKIPAHRKVEIFIDPEHSLFDNERRGQQIKDILQKNQIDAVFVTKNKKNRNYLSSVGLNVNLIKEKHIEKFLNTLYLFFFNIKNFHLHTYENKKYLFIFIFLIEILLILGILRFIISLIVPSARIIIQPSESSETIIYNVRYYPSNSSKSAAETRFLYAPFYTGSINYRQELTISTANSKYIANPSYGNIKIYNKKNKEYSIIKGTQFITSNGLIFRSTEDFTLPPGTQKRPSETIIRVKADDYDINGDLIGIRGNIKFKTEMIIRNLEESSLTKDIWAESIENFAGGESESIGTVTDEDIKHLKEKLEEVASEKRLDVVNENFSVDSGFLLPFETTTTVSVNRIETYEASGDYSATIKGTIYVTYDYLYVLRDDIFQIFTTYVGERPSENNLVIKLNPDTLQFLKDSNATNDYEVKKNGNVLTIPTQINIVQTYDFKNDPKQIIPDIKNKIAGKDIEEAKKLILSTYDEIGNVKVNTPLRYSSIPVIKSRIKITYKELNQ